MNDFPSVWKVRRLRDARSVIWRSPGFEHAMWARLITAGWTPGTYEQLRAWGGHAERVKSAVERQEGGGGTGLRRLITLAEAAADGDTRFSDIAPWLAVLAFEMDSKRSGRVQGLIHTWSRADSRLHGMRKWVDRLGSDTAALAFAAGLTWEEACARQDAGTLDPDALRVVAGLCGYLMPGVEAPAAVPR